MFAVKGSAAVTPSVRASGRRPASTLQPVPLDLPLAITVAVADRLDQRAQVPLHGHGQLRGLAYQLAQTGQAGVKGGRRHVYAHSGTAVALGRLLVGGVPVNAGSSHAFPSWLRWGYDCLSSACGSLLRKSRFRNKDPVLDVRL